MPLPSAPPTTEALADAQDALLEGVIVEPLQPTAPYDRLIPVEHRLARAIHRFRKKRSFVPSGPKYEVFKSYMWHGGVDVGCKSFVKHPQPDEMDSDGEGPPVDQEGCGLIKHLNNPKYKRTIDFTGLIREFLSTEIWSTIRDGERQESIDVAGPVLAKFMDYLLLHKVCPEYEEDVKGALEVANLATVQLPMCSLLSASLPSSRDKSLSAYYGGRLMGQLDEDESSFFPLKKREALLGVTREEMLSWRFPEDDFSWATLCPENVLIQLEEVTGMGKETEMIGRVLKGQGVVEGWGDLKVRLHIGKGVVAGGEGEEGSLMEEENLRGLLVEGEFGILQKGKVVVWVLERLIGVWPSYTPRTSEGWVSLTDDRNGW